MKKISLLILICLFSITSCKERKEHNTKKSVKVKVYKYKSDVVDQDPNNDFRFLYVILDALGDIDYYDSPTQINSYRTVSWSSATAKNLPAVLQDKSKLQELEEKEVELEEFSEEMQADLAENPNAIVEEEQEQSESESESDSDGDGGSDSGSDAGGGDGGGGDGGGGGD